MTEQSQLSKSLLLKQCIEEFQGCSYILTITRIDLFEKKNFYNIIRVLP